MTTSEAFIYDVVRTPRGRGKADGALHGAKPVALVVGLLRELHQRNPGVDPMQVDDLVLGCVSPIGDQGGNLARTAAIAAGYQNSAPGFQLNRFCASGLEAINIAAQKVRAGWDELVVAGGVESMSRVPMGSDGGPWMNDPETAYAANFVPQGIGADLIASLEGFDREDVDRFAVESQRRAAQALSEDAFSRSVIPVRDRSGRILLDIDELPRPDSTLESLSRLKPAFEAVGAEGFDAVALQKYHWLERINHVHTAANSSGIVDGAALAILGTETAGQRAGLSPRGRVVATAVVGSEPTIMLTGPTPATHKVLDRAGMTVDQIDLFEVNEAFAAVVMKFMKDLEVSHEKVNVNGGSIALGHPLGATGAMLVGTVLDELERRQQRFGLCVLCVGGGMGIATIIERL